MNQKSPSLVMPGSLFLKLLFVSKLSKGEGGMGLNGHPVSFNFKFVKIFKDNRTIVTKHGLKS